MSKFDWTRRGFLQTAGIASASTWLAASSRALASSGPAAAMQGRRQKIILDVDTGTDDAVALMFGALHPDLELIAATTVNGNVPVKNCTENSLRVFDHIGVDIPVYEGLAAPFFREDFPRPRRDSGGSRFHGQYLDLPAGAPSPDDVGRRVDCCDAPAAGSCRADGAELQARLPDLFCDRRIQFPNVGNHVACL